MFRRDTGILFNRTSTCVYIYSIMQVITTISVLCKYMSLHSGLLIVTNIAQIFQVFILVIFTLIIQLTIVAPRLAVPRL